MANDVLNAKCKSTWVGVYLRCTICQELAEIGYVEVNALSAAYVCVSAAYSQLVMLRFACVQC